MLESPGVKTVKLSVDTTMRDRESSVARCATAMLRNEATMLCYLCNEHGVYQSNDTLRCIYCHKYLKGSWDRS